MRASFSSSAAAVGSRYMLATAIVAFPGPPSTAQAVKRPSASWAAAAPADRGAEPRGLLTAMATPPGAGPRLPVLVAGVMCKAHPVDLAEFRAARPRSAVSRVSCMQMIWHILPAAAAMAWLHPQVQLDILAETSVRGGLLGLVWFCELLASAVRGFCAAPGCPAWQGSSWRLPALRPSCGVDAAGGEVRHGWARRHAVDLGSASFRPAG